VRAVTEGPGVARFEIGMVPEEGSNRNGAGSNRNPRAGLRRNSHSGTGDQALGVM